MDHAAKKWLNNNGHENRQLTNKENEDEIIFERWSLMKKGRKLGSSERRTIYYNVSESCCVDKYENINVRRPIGETVDGQPKDKLIVCMPGMDNEEKQ